MADQEDPYKGPGKLTAAVGKGITEGGITAAVGAAAGLAVAALSKGKFTYKTAATVGAATLGGAGALHGMYSGAHNVGKAQEQLDRTQTALATTTGLIEEQQRSFTKMLEQEKPGPGKGGRSGPG